MVLPGGQPRCEGSEKGTSWTMDVGCWGPDRAAASFILIAATPSTATRNRPLAGRRTAFFRAFRTTSDKDRGVLRRNQRPTGAAPCNSSGSSHWLRPCRSVVLPVRLRPTAALHPRFIDPGNPNRNRDRQTENIGKSPDKRFSQLSNGTPLPLRQTGGPQTTLKFSAKKG